jgi:Pyruvate/2-oxoglutarate dehydrogenase complex, dihydrolipoamide dehydrogenase (E3) component, and related enzymes
MSIHIAIVGAYGSAGVAAAQRLAPESDIKLTLIDDGEPGGGLCILRGCMPSKEVLSAAEHRFAARHDDRVNEPAPTVDLETVVERKNEHTSNFAAHRRAAVEQLTEHEDVNFIHDTAQFIDERMLSVGEQVIEPDYVIIATGSTVNEPSLPRY